MVHARSMQGFASAFLILLIIAAIWIVFGPVLHGQFLNWDDDRNFVQNAAYRGIGVAQMRWAWKTYHLGVWQPLAWLLFGVEYSLFGLNPAGYHAASILLHCFNTVFLYLVVIELLGAVEKRDRSSLSSSISLSAAAAVMLFAIHPLRVEAVAWISCQPYLPSATLFLLALYVYLRGHRTHAGDSRTLGIATAVFGLYLLAVGFKAVAITLPAILFVLDVWPLRRWRTWRRAAQSLVEKLPFVAVAALVAAWAVAAKDFSESRASFHDFDTGARLAHAAGAIWFYLFKTIAPTGLSAYYRLPSDLALSTPRFALAGACVVALTTVALRWRRRYPAILAAWLAYLSILSPNLGVIQISQQFVADRYSYLAIVGPTVLVAGVIYRILLWLDGSRKTRIVVIGIVLVWATALSRATWQQTRAWHDSETLWMETIALDPDCAVAHCNLGDALIQDGQYAAASRHLSKAIDLDPQMSFAYSNLGVVLCQARQFEDAVALGLKALDIQPGLSNLDGARTHAMLGQAYAGLRRDAEAWRHTREAQRLGLPEAQKMIDYLSKISKEPH